MITRITLANFTMSEAMMEYPLIKGAFNHIVPLCTALNITHPYVETNYTCPDWATYLSGMVNISTNTVEIDPNATSSSSVDSIASPTSGSTASPSAAKIAITNGGSIPKVSRSAAVLGAVGVLTVVAWSIGVMS